MKMLNDDSPLLTPNMRERRAAERERQQLIEERADITRRLAHLTNENASYEAAFDIALMMGFENPDAARQAIIDRMRVGGPTSVAFAVHEYANNGQHWQRRSPGPYRQPSGRTFGEIDDRLINDARAQICETLAAWHLAAQRVDALKVTLAEIDEKLQRLPKERSWRLWPKGRGAEHERER